ncbi:MAG: response regulator transcription factor [Actinobacteria bacterium]|nr:response regulator transcription factor [Actinomycetota bacterium]
MESSKSWKDNNLPGMKIFLVEDDQVIAENLKTVLEIEGIEVIHFPSGSNLIEKLVEKQPDAILLDLMLPDISGEKLLKEIRKKTDIPVIVISARDTELDKVLLIEMGADDYLTKPFSLIELKARLLRSIERHRKISKSETKEESEEWLIVAGPFELNTYEHIFKVGGKSIELTPKEFKIMELFMRNPNRVLSRRQIEDAVWEDGYITPKNLDVYVARIRSKLGEFSIHLKSVRGFGYKLEV